MRSLRWRLLAGGAFAILTALVAAWIFMTLLFGRHVEHRLAAELTRSGVQLVAAADADLSSGEAMRSALTDPRLQTPGSGFYWQVSLPSGQALRSRSLWDQTLPTGQGAAGDAWQVSRLPGPFGPTLLMVERQVQLSPGAPLVKVQVAQDATELAQAQREFGFELAGFLGLLWLALSAAAWLQVHLGLRPLAHIRSEVEALRTRPAARIHGADLREIAPLTQAINALLDARAEDLARARRRAADMAHGLKTPLAAMAAQIRRLPVEGPAVEGLERSVEAIRRTVNAELARSRIAASQAGSGATAEVGPVVQQLVAVLTNTERGDHVRFEISVPAGLTAPLGGSDLTEILGAVLENAARHAATRVQVSAEAGGEIGVLIDDDGPGMPAELRQAVVERGARLDEYARPGDGGLGLSIAQGLMDASGGALRLEASPLGGLRAVLAWPAAPDGARR